MLAESRGQAHRHFDLAGAASVTSGVMLLVYAMTRATQEGWGSTTTVSLLIASAVLLIAFVGIELRSPAPLLPMRIFRNRMLSAANATAAMIGAIAFSEFFLLTLYMQQVLRYSAVETGVGFAAMTGTIIVFSNVAQTAVTRFGVRSALTAGLTHRCGRAGVVHAAAGARDVLLGSVPGVPRSAASASRSRSCR